MSQVEKGNSGVTGVLTVFVHRGKELINVKKTDKQSPFVILRVGHMTCRSKICFRGGQKPEWSFVAKFQVTPEIKSTLEIDCFHETEKAPKFIGKSKVDFTSAVFANEEDGDDRWVDLYNGVEYAGKIYLEMSFRLGSTNGNSMMGSDEFGNSVTSNGMGNNLVYFQQNKNNVLDDIQSFDLSIRNREVPNFPTTTAFGQNSQNINYHHGVVTSEPEINNYLSNESDPISNMGSSSNSTGSANKSFFNNQHQNSSYLQQRSNYSSEYNSLNSRNYIDNGHNNKIGVNSPSNNVVSSTIGSSSSSEPLFAKLRELKGKMFTFKNPQGAADKIDRADNFNDIRGDEKNNDHRENRRHNMDNVHNINNNLSNSKSSKNSQLSREQLDFQILEKAIAGGLPYEQSTNNKNTEYFNINDNLPPLPDNKVINNNNNYMGARIESTRTFSKSRITSQPMMPMYNKSRKPPLPMP
ncbi:hypothetical protein QEN19_004318 [Hanseniaspora menglaensis]